MLGICCIYRQNSSNFKYTASKIKCENNILKEKNCCNLEQEISYVQEKLNKY